MSIPSKSSNPPLGTDGDRRHSLDELFETALKGRLFSGASLLVANPEKILFQKTWGHTRESGSPVDAHSWFDLASLTKPLVTVPLCMWAVGRKIIDLDDPLSRFFPAGVLPADKRFITLSQLLNHCGGLPAYEPYYLKLIEMHPISRREALLSWILGTPLLAPPGKISTYSDLGFILLGMILEHTLEAPLDRLSSRWLTAHGPLAMADESGSEPDSENHESTLQELAYCRLLVPTDPAFPPERTCECAHSFVATEHCPWRRRILEGEVHDENAYCMGGVAGHAGIFGTARGVFRLTSFLWNIYRGTIEDPQWSAEVIRTFWKRQRTVPGSTWALGFDTPSSVHSSTGEHFSPQSIGHLGFTGTSFWMDLEREIMVILLTNRVYPTRSNEGMKVFRPVLHNLAMKAFHGNSKH